MKIEIQYFQFYSWVWVFVIFSGNILAQSNTPDTTDNLDIQHQLWIDIYPHFYINEKLEYYGDLGYRTLLDDNIWHWIYVRPSIRYYINDNWELQGGIGFFYVINKFDSNRFETRPWQGIQLNWPNIKNLSFKTLLRLEERISFMTEDWSSSFDLRLRLKISGRLNLCRECSDRFWYIPFYGEAFFEVTDGIDELIKNRGRAGIGLGYNATKSWRFSFITNWQSSRSGSENEFQVTDIIYQFKIRKRWNKDKKISFFRD